MQILDVNELPEVINNAISWENALLLLSYRCFSLQESFNNTVPENEQKKFISIIKTLESANNPYVEISLSNIEINFVNGQMKTPSSLGSDSFVPRNIYPWNSSSSLECLVNMFFKTLEFEQSSITNPDAEDISTVTLTQNTEINVSMFTLSTNIILPVNVIEKDGSIDYTIIEYLQGSFPN